MSFKKINIIFVLSIYLLLSIKENAYANFSDFLIFANSYGKTTQDTEYNSKFDYNSDGTINESDLEHYIVGNTKSEDDEGEEQVPGDLDGNGMVDSCDENIQRYMQLMILFYQNSDEFLIVNPLLPQNNISNNSNLNPAINPNIRLDSPVLGNLISSAIANIGYDPGIRLEKKGAYGDIFKSILGRMLQDNLDIRSIFNNAGDLVSIELFNSAGVQKAILFGKDGEIAGTKSFEYNGSNGLVSVRTYDAKMQLKQKELYGKNGEIVKTESYDGSGDVVGIVFHENKSSNVVFDQLDYSSSAKDKVEFEIKKERAPFLSDVAPAKINHRQTPRNFNLHSKDERKSELNKKFF